MKGLMCCISFHSISLQRVHPLNPFLTQAPLFHPMALPYKPCWDISSVLGPPHASFISPSHFATSSSQSTISFFLALPTLCNEQLSVWQWQVKQHQQLDWQIREGAVQQLQVWVCHGHDQRSLVLSKWPWRVHEQWQAFKEVTVGQEVVNHCFSDQDWYAIAVRVDVLSGGMTGGGKAFCHGKKY